MIVNKANVDQHATPNAEVFRLATPATGSQELSVIAQRMDVGHTNPPHRHDREEVMIITDGSVTVTVGEEQSVVQAGDTCIIPANTLHSVSVDQGDPARWIIVSTKGVQFASASGEVMKPGWAE